MAAKTAQIGLVTATLIILLVADATLNYLDRLAISTLAPALVVGFRLSKLQWGSINSCFNFVYIGTSLLGGVWIDRVGVRKGLAISTMVWGVATVGHATAGGFWSLCGWRMLLAVGEGPATAAMVKGIRRLMPPRLRDAGNGLINGGFVTGAMLAPLVVWPIVSRYGWRAAFVATGCLCFLWLPLWLVVAWCPQSRLGYKRIHLKLGSDHPVHPVTWRSFSLWATIVAVFFTVPPTVFTNTFVPLYLAETYRLDVTNVSRYYWQPFLAADCGQIAGGLLVYVLLRISWSFLGARRVVITLGFVGSLTMLGIIAVPTLGRAMAWLDLARFMHQMGYTSLLAYGIESVPEDKTASMAGLINATFSACNFVLNLLIGEIVDYCGSYRQVVKVISFSPLLGLVSWLILGQLHAQAMTANKDRPAQTR